MIRAGQTGRQAGRQKGIIIIRYPTDSQTVSQTDRSDQCEHQLDINLIIYRSSKSPKKGEGGGNKF